MWPCAVDVVLCAARCSFQGIGSTCTLVSEILGNDIPQDLGVLLMSTVLLDTRYFDTDKRFKETDQRDFMAVEKLQALRCVPGQELWWCRTVGRHSPGTSAGCSNGAGRARKQDRCGLHLPPPSYPALFWWR